MRIRSAEPGDLADILDVLRSALGETPLLRRTPELFAWKHRVNPFGESIVLVAEIGGKVAGVRALMPWRLTTGDGTILSCVRPVDTATHPDFSRRGIFRQLTMSALDVARDRGIHLVFNTPNPQSAAGYLKMGWGEVGWIGGLVRPRVGRAHTPANGRTPTLEETIPAAQPFQPVIDADRPARGLRTPRTIQYQGWRFNDHPTASYGWIPDPAGGGAVVRPSTRNGRTELVVSDLLGGAGKASIRIASRDSRARYLAGWFSPTSPERRSAVAGGMLPVPGMKTLRMVALPLAELDIDVFDLSSWDFATSDLELL
jgi:GNAT superfamily N-acetyltransferase